MMLALGLFFFVLLILVHEFGHFIVARRNGVEVEEFGLGFPPKLAGKRFKKGDTEYTVNALPLGGFVRLKGENDSDRRQGSLGAASYWAKTKIMFAGVAMNFLTAVALFTVLALIGIPTFVENQFSVAWDANPGPSEVVVVDVQEGSVAAELGLAAPDHIVSINGEHIDTEDELMNTTKSLSGQEVTLVYARDGQETVTVVTLNDGSDDKGYLGVVPTTMQSTSYGVTAPIVGLGTAVQVSVLTLQGLGNLFIDLIGANFGDAKEMVSGPVGVVSLLGTFGAFGLSALLFFIAIMSLTLAVINMLPIPALDGGRWFVMTLYRVLKKPLNQKTEELIHGTGFALLMLLLLLITVVDIDRFILK